MENIERITRITTSDTKKTYELPGGNIPELWEARVALVGVEPNGSASNYHNRTVSIYLERETLENAGLVPMRREKKDKKVIPEETAEDLILRLLEFVGVYPAQ